MQIVLLGSGNIATHLGRGLKLAGLDIVQVWSRDYKNAHKLADSLAAQPVKKLADITADADLYLIAVTDGAIADVAKAISTDNRLIVHTSGSTSLDILTSFSSRTGVFYPLQTFSKNKAVDFRQVPIAIEGGNKEVIQFLRLVAERLSEKVIELSSADRLALHVSAVFACNFTNHLYAIAKQLLAQRHLNFDLIKPLITETAERIKDNDPATVQTGPAVRSDLQTVSKHVDFLKDDTRLQEIYEKLSQSIASFNKNSQP